MGRTKTISDDELLARARDVIIEKGVNASSREIAKAIGISSSVLFQRFGSMDELLLAALTIPKPDISDVVQAARNEPDPKQSLTIILSGLLDYFREMVPLLLPLVTVPAFNFENVRQNKPDLPIQNLLTEVFVLIEQMRHEGKIGVPCSGALTLNLVSIAHSIAMFEHIGAHGGEFSPETLSSAIDLIWSGAAPKEP